jgi:hypothetical protein
VIAYLDTSALVKLLLSEADSDVANDLWVSADTVLTSQLTYPESRAALARADRLGRLTAGEADAAVTLLTHVTDHATCISLDEALSRSAGELAQRHGLFGPDAVHLATAVSALSGELVFVSWEDARHRRS